MTKVLTIVALLVLVAAGFISAAPAKVSVPEPPFKAKWQSLTNYQCPEWFRDAKFGIWAHWGAECQPAHGNWYARKMYMQGDTDYKSHLAEYGHPSTNGFKEVANSWKGEHFDPDALLKFYKENGAKYFMALANFHDNFDNWNSKYQPWNSVNVGPHKDIIGLWSAAAKKQGLPFGVSLHASHAWSWLEVAQRADKTGPLAGVLYDGRLTKADGKGLWWDGLDPQDLYAQNHAPGHKLVWEWDPTKGSSVPDAAYQEKFFKRTQQLWDDYQPDLIYFDDDVLPLHGVTDEIGLKLAAHFYNSSIQRHHGQNEAVMTDKHLDEFQRRTQVYDFERGKAEGILPQPWQTDTCIADWLYNEKFFREHRYKSAASVIRMLTDIVSKNGNLMLSVPLRGDGTPDSDEIEIVKGIGAWLKINGEAIYATRPWKVYGEGPSTALHEKGQFDGQTDVQKKPFTAEDIRFTQSKDGRSLYAITLNVPTNEVRIQSLAGIKIGDVKLLGGEEKIRWRSETNALVIQPTTNWPSEIAVAWKILLKSNDSNAVVTTNSSSATKRIVLNPAAGGRIFEGIGAVSAGASSRLLVEYPEKQRAEVLDYLFKPNFGAGFQHLKVEIGGEVNSTDGIELTHMRSHNDENYQRGYEWWLMKEAKKRNYDVILDCLAWGAPGWIGNGKYYSQDMADYVVKFLQGAKKVHHLDIAYTGIWNETSHDTNWIKLLRRTLDSSGWKKVGIVAADDYDKDGWKIVDQVKNDPELCAAVARVGVHYRDSKSPPKAQNLGCPLWSSEDGPWCGDWNGATRLARTINRNYVIGKFTKTEIWSPVTSYYDSLPLPGSGVMRANEPWSGHYEVQPAVWAVAHTTQFAAPGWRYLDSACVMIDGGSVVALESPRGKNFSLIIETMDAKLSQTLEFQITNLPNKILHVWQTSKEMQFEELADIHPAAGKFSLTIEPNCLYSLTTTRGQRKGVTTPPTSAALPLPYFDDFSNYKPGESPQLFSDQSGVFEIQKRADGPDNCLREVLRHDGIPWHSHVDPKPETILGDLKWKDYTVAVDAQIPTNGYALLLGRVTIVPQNNKLPSSYVFKVTGAGDWELRAIRTTVGPKPWDYKTSGDTGTPLAEGRAGLGTSTWHHFELSMVGDEIAIRSDKKTLATVHDTMHSRGQIGLGSDWSGADFAKLSVRPDSLRQ